MRNLSFTLVILWFLIPLLAFFASTINWVLFMGLPGKSDSIANPNPAKTNYLPVLLDIVEGSLWLPVSVMSLKPLHW